MIIRKSNLLLFLIPLLLLIFQISLAQQGFSEIYKNMDPARASTDQAEKKSLHTEFLADALSNDDTFRIILGQLYLSDDLLIDSEYTIGMEQLIHAGKLAASMKDTLLLGRVNYKKGAIYSSLQNYEHAIDYYEKSLGLSTIAKDSLFIAIALEQLGRRYANIQDYDKSNQYYLLAMPMVEKFCKPSSKASALINYGNSLDEQGSVAQAIQAYEKAITIGIEIQDDYIIIPAKQNLALVYSSHDSLDQALRLYWECKAGNEQNGWLDYLMYSYEGLSFTHKKMGNSDSAYYYFQKYHFLRDSVIGTRIHEQINDLETNVEIQKKDIEILTQKEKSLKSQRYLRNTIILAIILLTLISWIALYFFHKNKISEIRLQENRNSLGALTEQLASKNSELRDLAIHRMDDAKTNEESDKIAALKHLNYYDMTILTEKDWQTFKALFEKSYPNLLGAIRFQFSDISPAEERLFLFIYLQISTSESANILGVLPETIRKTRTRLRKRLGLSRGKNLNEFIQRFSEKTSVFGSQKSGE